MGTVISSRLGSRESSCPSRVDKNKQTKKKANAVKMKNDPTGHLKRNRPSPESTLSPHGVNTAVHRTFSVPCAARQL